MAVPEKKKNNNKLWILGGIIVLVGVIVGVAVGNKNKNSSEPVDLMDDDSSSPKSALIIIDVQDCFLESSVTSTGEPGSLAVEDTASLIEVINMIRESRDCLFDVVVRTRDFHPKLQISFAATHGLPASAHATSGKGGLPITCTNTQNDASCCPTYWLNPGSQNCTKVLCPDEEQMTDEVKDHVLASKACTSCKNGNPNCVSTTQAMWPDHCVQGEEDGIPPTLLVKPEDITLDKGDLDYVNAYSAFMDNNRNIKTELDSILEDSNVNTIYLVGIAADYGVRFAVDHALRLGYKTNVIFDGTCGVDGGIDGGIDDGDSAAALVEMAGLGASVMNSKDILDMECPTQVGSDKILKPDEYVK